MSEHLQDVQRDSPGISASAWVSCIRTADFAACAVSSSTSALRTQSAHFASCANFPKSSAAVKRRAQTGLVHRSDRSSQYTSIRYTERLAELGIEPSVGPRGDSYDNALAEAVNAVYKSELFNHQRLHENLGCVPPAEFEATYFTASHQTSPPALAVATT